MADILEESRNPAIEAYRAAYIANSSNSTPNSNSNPSKKGKNKKKGKKKASYNIKGQNYGAKSAEQASFMLGSYNLAIKEEEEFDSSSNSSSITLEVLSRKAPPTYTKLVLDNVLYLPNIDINIVSRVRHYNSEGCLIKETLYRGDRRCIAVLDFKKSGFFLDVKGSSKPILHANFAFPLGLTSYNTSKSIELQRNKIVVEFPSNSIRKEDYRPIIEDAIVSEAIEPNKRYKLRNSPAKGTTLEGVGPSLRGKRPRRPVEPLATAQAPYQSPRKTREPKPLTGTGDLPYMLREPVIKGNKVVEKAISSPTLKEPNIGQRDYYNLLNLAKLWHVRLGYIGLRLLKKTSSITKGLPNFDKIKEADFHCSSCDRGKVVRRVSKALIPDPPRVLDSIEGDTVKIRPRPYNRNPIVLLLVDRKSRYRWVFNLPNKSGPLVANAIKGLRGLRNGFGRYPTKFHFDGVNSTAITNKETTPFQALFDELEPGIPHITNLERYRAIGAKGEAIIPLEKRSKSLKLTSRMEECKLLVVLGFETYLVYIPSRRAVLKTSTVKFIEDNTVLKGAVSPDPSNLNTEKPISIEIGPSKLESYESSSDSELDEPSPDKPINPVIPITNEPLNNSDLISKGDKMQLDYYKLLAKTSSYILSFVYKARKRVISKDKLGVFKFLPRSLLPSNRKLITCRNVLKVKKDAKNRPVKYKSRLVARGFMQVEGLDYTITYASTSILPTWRILLAIGAVLDWEIEQADFIGAFLNSALREEIYMEIPKGLLDLAASNKAIYKLLLKYGYNPSTPNIIKLSKALYSLKQSPREWQDKLKILLKSLGYLPLISDLGVFYNAKTCHFIVTYIDDCLFIGPNIGYITDLKKRLNKVYAIEDLGPAAYFLGVQIIRDRPNRRLWLNHQLQLEEDITSYLCNSTEIKLYQSLVGTAIYIMLLTRVDISFTVQWLSRSLNRPTKSHLNAAKNLFKYLNSTKDYSICFCYNGNTVADLGPKLSNSSNITTKLRDKATSKSTYGYLYKLAGRPISWKTKRATTIALSTLEAETDGLTEAIREVQWIIGLFSKLYRPIDYPFTLYRDNQGSITVANDPALHARTKHTLLKFRYVREQVKAKIVTIIYLNTKYMPANGLTKALPHYKVNSSLFTIADQAKGKGIAPKRASNPADPGQSSRPPLPIQTLLEDKEDSKDYNKVIEVLKQYIKSHKRVVASQSSNIKTLLLSPNTLKASIKDSVSAIKNISSTLASLTHSSNAMAATTGKTSYSPRFDPFSGTIDLDSPLYPPRKEPYLGPAVDSATSNLDPPIDTGSKEGFKDTITSSIVKELSKKAYTIPDDKISNFLENPDISNTYSNSNQAVLLMLLRNSLSSSPRAAISRPIESKKEDVYDEFHALTFSTFRKGLSAFNAEFNGYLTKLTIAKIDIDPSLILNHLNIEYLIADILEESRNPATEVYKAAHIANSSNSTPNSNSNPSKKGKNKKKGKKKASYNIEGQNYSAKSAEQASFILGSYNLAIEEEEESDSSSNSSSSSDSNTQLAQLLALKGYKKRKDFKGKGLKTSSNKAKYKDNQSRRRPRNPALYNSWLYNIGSTDHISNSQEHIGSITLEVLSRKVPPTYTKLLLDNVLYLPNININIISRVRHYNSGGCLIKETLYRGDRRYIAILDFKKSGFFLNVKGSSKPILHANFAFPLGLTSYNTTKSIEPQYNKIVVGIPSNSIRKEDYRPIIEDAIVSKAIEPNKRYKLRDSPAKGTTLEGIGPSLRGRRPYRPVEPLATA
ncbi:hypothetical protein P8C59_009619 [Phyllachora maydis]|uniref:Reverse transcriptase Ty1/copia-type domain-containing protein n=1 Tax=Phyllachora maydis TaxID=1825666 RepID=A0AAD9MGK8_9PEZI|nr:hypothetical protein P8C59_009619 [Phyllachora maydis]